MWNIEFLPESVEQVRTYIRHYRSYYEELYSDSGVWSEEQIIQGYRQEAVARYEEIFDTIEQHLKGDIVSYMKNETVIRWRSKVLLVGFIDKNTVRTITDIQIR